MSDEVLSPDEQIIRDMGDEMNEIRVGRAKAYFQIRRLRTQLAADSKEHLETWKRLKKAETELRRWRGCPSCKEDHDDSVMCPPHEVRTSGRAWFHTQARKWAERAERAEAERDELQRKLDACQCETRVLNESMLIEAKRERDQLAAEAVLAREALEMIARIKLNESDPNFIGICPMRIGFLRPVHMSKVKEVLATTPHAAKYTERVRKLEAVAEIATRVANTWREYPPFTFDEMDELRAALDRLDTLDKTKGEKS